MHVNLWRYAKQKSIKNAESVEAGWVRGRLRNVPRGRLAVEEVTGCGPDLPQRFIEALSRLARSDLYDYIFVELLGDQNPLHLAHLLTLSDARGTPLSDFLQVRLPSLLPSSIFFFCSFLPQV
jgi:hypothetical protein